MLDLFATLDAIGQAELVRRGDVHPLELVDAAIARIERLNPALNAVITPLFDRARAQAASKTLPPGPFRGVPILLKDFLCHTAGDPYYEGMRFSAVRVHAATQRLIAGVMRVPEWWAAGFDLLVTPTMQQPPPRIDQLTLDQQGPVFGLFAMPYSITGQPAISLPLHWNAENLPIGVQLVADYGREDLLIRVAAQLEQAQPWATRLAQNMQSL